MMRAPSRSRSAEDSAFTVACVPTGMNTGVSTSPCAVASTPARARPADAITWNVWARSRRLLARSPISIASP